jgi:3-hydroxyacyl-[acyl-carrier-protein] dehydratase
MWPCILTTSSTEPTSLVILSRQGVYPCPLVELLEQQQGRALILDEVKNLKFIAPISPLNVPIITVTFQKLDVEEGRLATKGLIACDGKTYTKFSILLRL